jgi:hypothetical protein
VNNELRAQGGGERASIARHPLWRRWVAANIVAEVVGLGLTLALTGLVIGRLANIGGLAGVVLAFAAAVLSGAIEATIVGLAQWWAMRPWLPQITRRAWWLASLAGALLAYVLGYLPSTLINLMQSSADASAAPMTEPPQAVVLLLAAGLGAVAGAILSFAQYFALRGRVAYAGRWIPANMLAWAVGMPIVFWAIDLAFKLPALWQAVALMSTALLLMGAVVGAIHGAFLVRMVAATARTELIKTAGNRV